MNRLAGARVGSARTAQVLRRRRSALADLSDVLKFLRCRGECPAARVKTTAVDDLVAQYGQHLQDHQGLATITIERYRTVARRFLHERFGCGVVDLRTLRAGDVIAFVQRQAKFMQPPALKCVATALRSFLRYAQYRGEVATALAAAVPIAAARTTTPAVPKAISAENAQCAIDSCDLSRHTALPEPTVKRQCVSCFDVNCRTLSGRACSFSPGSSDVNLFRDGQSIVDLDAKISDCTFDPMAC